MVIVRYYTHVVECGKLIAFCKVFFTLFFPILQHSPTFPFISHYPTSFPIILQHSSLFNIILHHSPSFPIILQHSTNRHYFSTIFFDNIFFRQHSTTYLILRQNHFSTRNFCHLLSNKKLVVYCIINLIISACYYQLNIIIILLSLSYYQLNIINLLLSLSYYQFDIISLIITKLFSIDIHL